MAAAGIDMSNVPEGTALRLPLDPDASARALCAGLRNRIGVDIAIIITDTIGRAWRVGQTDMAIGICSTPAAFIASKNTPSEVDALPIVPKATSFPLTEKFFK